MARITIAHVNAALRRNGIPDTLRKGRGYYYFTGPNADYFHTQGVTINRVGQLTEQGWLLAYKELLDANHNHRINDNP